MLRHLLFILVLPFTLQSQHTCSLGKAYRSFSAPASAQAVHESAYDVKFVHLSLNVERVNKYISGNARTIATVTVAALDTFQTLLHQNLTIDSVRFNGALISVIRQDSIVKGKTPSTLSSGSTFTAIVYYNGIPPTGGSAIGNGFSNAASPSWGNQVTWSLSESFVAYHWWPCKQMLTDKIDSSWVFITTDSTNKAGSNGILTAVVPVGAKKRYEWKSRKPIDYYLISVAVAKYKEYNLYAKPQYLNGDSILIQNYIYDVALNASNFGTQKATLNKMPRVLEFLSDMYGMYPFYREKYGHCMAPLSGGMEHQTMSTVGFFDYYVDAHELGHQWWGDNVTCKSWGDIWINEGFAAYTEHLVAEYLDPLNFATNLNDVHVSVMSQPGGSIFFTGSDTLNTPRIFSSRLTYDKGGAILHSLRFVTNNDSLWFGVLRGFQAQYANKTASAADFKNYYDSFTGSNSTQFFSQWYYGQGYPTFDIKYNSYNGNFYMNVNQTVSMPPATPLFITPLEYRLVRTGKPDTIVRVMHSQASESYTIPLSGTVTSVHCDPRNWIINAVKAVVKDVSLGVPVTSIASANSGGITVSPNPCTGSILVSGVTDGWFRLTDCSGRVVMDGALQGGHPVDVSSVANGLYFLRVSGEAGETVTRLIRQ